MMIDAEFITTFAFKCMYPYARSPAPTFRSRHHVQKAKEQRFERLKQLNLDQLYRMFWILSQFPEIVCPRGTIGCNVDTRLRNGAIKFRTVEF